MCFGHFNTAGLFLKSLIISTSAQKSTRYVKTERKSDFAHPITKITFNFNSQRLLTIKLKIPLKTEGSSWKSVLQSTRPSLLINTGRKKKEGGTEPQEEQRKLKVFKKSHFYSQIYATPSVSLEDEQLIRVEVTFRTNTTLLKKVKAIIPLQAAEHRNTGVNHRGLCEKRSLKQDQLLSEILGN